MWRSVRLLPPLAAVFFAALVFFLCPLGAQAATGSVISDAKAEFSGVNIPNGDFSGPLSATFTVQVSSIGGGYNYVLLPLSLTFSSIGTVSGPACLANIQEFYVSYMGSDFQPYLLSKSGLGSSRPLVYFNGGLPGTTESYSFLLPCDRFSPHYSGHVAVYQVTVVFSVESTNSSLDHYSAAFNLSLNVPSSNLSCFTDVPSSVLVTDQQGNQLQQQTNQKLDSLTNGYDSSAGDSVNDKLSSGIGSYEEAEGYVVQSAIENFVHFEFGSFFDFVPELTSTLSLVSSFVNGFIAASGGFGFVVSFVFALALVSIVVGIWRFRR